MLAGCGAERFETAKSALRPESNCRGLNDGDYARALEANRSMRGGRGKRLAEAAKRGEVPLVC